MAATMASQSCDVCGRWNRESFVSVPSLYSRGSGRCAMAVFHGAGESSACRKRSFIQFAVPDEVLKRRFIRRLLRFQFNTEALQVGSISGTAWSNCGVSAERICSYVAPRWNPPISVTITSKSAEAKRNRSSLAKGSSG